MRKHHWKILVTSCNHVDIILVFQAQVLKPSKIQCTIWDDQQLPVSDVFINF
jgi:hypothetical protein